MQETIQINIAEIKTPSNVVTPDISTVYTMRIVLSIILLKIKLLVEVIKQFLKNM